ncbi:hypothetical protein ACFYS8_14450 [Kitasatospora sp. NPDC004615]|uniref:hypothetical protein n=1 Tax=unclassified Kitasatospora TaxID=2633591 RepID=UPI0036CB25EA
MSTFALLGTGDDPTGPRPPTTDEANRLALTRFRNYEAGGRALTITVPGTAGRLTVTGSVDFRTRTGYGVLHGTGRDSSTTGLIQWTPTTVRVLPMPDAPATAPATPPASGWSTRPLQTTGSSLDTSLAIALNLAADRPDNPQLLPQNGATWLSRTTLNGHPTDVITGPNARGTTTTSDTVRYWIDPDGTMYRVQAALASDPQPVIVDFDTQPYAPVPGVTPTP